MRAASAAVSAAVLIAVLCAGLWLGGHPSDLPSALSDIFVDKTTTLSGDAAEAIEDKYFRPTSRTELNNGSIAGMIAALRHRHKEDRFSQYLDPAQAQRLNEETEGRFTGVGLSVTEVKRGLKVAEVFKGSPAARAGIKVGDVIVSVNGKSIAGKSSTLSTEMIKGPAGTEVTLGVVPAGGGRTRRVKVRRAQITSPVVKPSLRRVGGEKLGYVAFGGPDIVTSFSDGAHGALREAVQQLEDRGAQGFLLDLRGNPGGLLNEAVLTASDFLPKGEVVVSTRSRTEGSRVYKAAGDPLPRRPMVILIDRGTASAAEILASALADHGLATIVGTRSFGKGLFQDVLNLSNGGELDLTVGEFFTADGISLAPKGIHPDVFAKDNPRTKPDEGLRRALEVLGSKVSAAGSGAQAGAKSKSR
jgi:carboxyl-terminal processing protease